MTVAWPNALPSPAADSLKIARPDVRTALEMDNGSIRRIRRSLSAPWHVDGEIWLTPAQKAAFDHFYRFELRDGLWWFTAPWLDGLGLTGMAARFREPPRLTRASATLWKAAVRFEAIDATQALDTQDWPISNVVSVTGIPTDHMAFWLKPDAFSDPVGTYYPLNNTPIIASYHDPSVMLRAKMGGYHASLSVGSFQGFPSLSLNPDGLYNYWANHYPGCPWLLIPLPQIFDCAITLVYGCDSLNIGFLIGRALDVRNAPDSIGWGNPTTTDAYSAEPYRVRVNVGDGYSTNSNATASPTPYLRIATFNTPFRHGTCAAWWNGRLQVANFPARYKIFGMVAGGSLSPGNLVVGCNYADHTVRHAHILELVVWRKILTAAEVTAVHNHFIDKYAIPL